MPEVRRDPYHPLLPWLITAIVACFASVVMPPSHLIRTRVGRSEELDETLREVARLVSEAQLKRASHLRVLDLVTGTTVAPSRRMRATFSAWRLVSSSPMYTTHSRPRSAAAVAVATPC